MSPFFAAFAVCIVLSFVVSEVAIRRNWSLLTSIAVALIVGGVVTLLFTLLGVH